MPRSNGGRALLAPVALVALGAFAGGCSAAPTDASSTAAGTASPTAVAATSPEPSPSPSPEPSPSPSPSPEATAAPIEPELDEAELAALGVNELGRVVVAEWHVIGDTDGEYRTSRETFRAQLQDLYERGYRPVSQAEFIAGTFPILAGTSPVVLTFDDSTRDQFALDDAGQPVPDTAVGIIEQFAAEHPDWRATAVFAFNFPDPFGDGGYEAKLRWLVDNGYELSNHSVGHANLGSLSSAEVVANLAENQARLHEAVPGVPVPSLTLPYGAHAADPDTERAGTADGVTYRHDLVYLVGAYPTRSPHHAAFDGGAVQRVPAHAVVGTGPEWFGDQLDQLESDASRFVSDGRADTVTFPAALEQDAAVRDPDLRVRTY